MWLSNSILIYGLIHHIEEGGFGGRRHCVEINSDVYNLMPITNRTDVSTPNLHLVRTISQSNHLHHIFSDEDFPIPYL